MRLLLAFAFLIGGIVLMYGGMLSALTYPLSLLGLFLMLLGAVQIAFIVSANMFPHTPPALENLFRNDRKVLWVFAPIVAMIGTILRIVWLLFSGGY